MPTNSYLFARPPVWKNHPPEFRHSINAELQSWLQETGSLTKRLRAIHGRQFGVNILFHRRKPAFIDECQALELQPQRYQLIREVLLHSGGRPLVLARTVLPQQTVEAAGCNLAHLGNRPLGEIIFAFPDLELRQRQYSHAPGTVWSPHLPAGMAAGRPLWGRRTLYAIHRHPLLVAEFFLPGMFPENPETMPPSP